MPDANIFLERRVHPRISLKIPVKYRVVDDPKEIQSVSERRISNQNSHTMDVSLGGMYLVADQVLNVGTILRLEISIPEISHVVTVFAEVVWSNETGGGLHFEAIKEDDLESLKRYLSQKPPR